MLDRGAEALVTGSQEGVVALVAGTFRPDDPREEVLVARAPVPEIGEAGQHGRHAAEPARPASTTPARAENT
jgi:hypothetical protein